MWDGYKLWPVGNILTRSYGCSFLNPTFAGIAQLNVRDHPPSHARADTHTPAHQWLIYLYLSLDFLTNLSLTALLCFYILRFRDIPFRQ